MGDKQLPAVFNYCVQVYDAMDEDAVEENGLRVWTGHTTKLFTDRLHLSIPYYTACLTHLKRMDCLRQLYRGGGGTKSKWAVIQPPNEELFRSNPAQKAVTKKDDILGQQIRGVNSTVLDHDARLDQFEARLKVLEERVG